MISISPIFTGPQGRKKLHVFLSGGGLIRHLDRSNFGRDALMRFASVHPFVGAAKRANPGFDLFHQPERGAALLLSGAPADQAFHAEPGQGFVERGWFLVAHVTATYPFLRDK